MTGLFCKIPPMAPFLDPFVSATMTGFDVVSIKSIISRGGFLSLLENPPITKILAERNKVSVLDVSNNR